MTLPEITTAIKSITFAKDIIKNFAQLKTKHEILDATIELKSSILEIQSNLLSIQSSYQSLLDSKSKIENELKSLKDWETEKLNYELKKIGTGIFVYVPKSPQNSPDPEYYLCANCFNKESKKSVLQLRYDQHADLFCPACKTVYRIPDKNSGATHTSFRR